MNRVKWKGPFLKKNSVLKKNKRIASRDTEIVPKFIGFSFSVHTGKNYTNLIIKESMVGHKFGEFSFTRLKN